MSNSIDSQMVINKALTHLISRDRVLQLYQLGCAEGNGKWGDTIELTVNLKELQNTRNPFYLTIENLESILVWKLRQQIGRQKTRRQSNTNHNIIEITKAAFAIVHSDFEWETTLKIKLLTTLPGIEIPIASAILTLCFPEKYAIIDRRNWKSLFDDVNKTSYSIKEYLFYLGIIKKIANHYGVTTQQVDIALWTLD